MLHPLYKQLQWTHMNDMYAYVETQPPHKGVRTTGSMLYLMCDTVRCHMYIPRHPRSNTTWTYVVYHTFVCMHREMHHQVTPTCNRRQPRLFVNVTVTILPYPHAIFMLLHRGHVRITIFSKFFSQLPHGTCLLSDSDICQYFDET